MNVAHPRLALLLLALLGGCASQPMPAPTAPAPPPATAQEGVFTDAAGHSRTVAIAALSHTGNGSYRWPDGRRYSGAWRRGRPHGTGTQQWPDGRRYQGQYRNGQFHGTGTYTAASGAVYRGQWVDGARHGQGRQEDAKGRYVGAWRAGVRHGEGRFAGSDGSRYVGDYLDDLRHGRGTLTRPDGSRYEGDWLADEPAGFGTLTWPDGRRREGQWVDGRSSGYGEFSHPAGLHYRGHWRDDLRHGYGEETQPDGSHYAGDWQRDQRHGSGRLTFADGRVHAGEWQQGRISGRGTRSSPAGYSLTGLWIDGRLPSGRLQLGSGSPYEGALFTTGANRLHGDLADWLAARAQAGDATAAFLLALRGGDSRARPGYLLQAANADIAAAQVALARSLLEADPRGALTWLERAAAVPAQPQPAAHFLLGQLYHLNPALPQDEDQAEDHYRRAIALGSISARRNLALMLATTSISYLRDPMAAIALLAPLADYYDDAQLLEALALVYEAAGRPDKARAARARARDLSQEETPS